MILTGYRITCLLFKLPVITQNGVISKKLSRRLLEEQ